ncbi:HAD-IIIA family hydrolase [Reinekea marina]|uniref:3-deoxy-D-manno-octulosonate 8-phosphate phosphatase KdsC n=1 Tax=Reinekea marina TaxID=1310421 RepID=A0ABV7WUW8_9GAMM|nr:HAD-IIIA family hydrolase [Reinekea marina]MDN3649624.1 HAD-IIIA family hydrolase [Reinekea marina]
MEISSELNKKLSKLSLVVFDVDGVLTDGKLYYTEQGEAIKVFHVRDGVGLKLLSDMGIQVAIVTAKDSKMVAKRISELGIKYYFPGVKNKQNKVTELASKLGLPLEEVAFVGDDMVDIPAINVVGVSMCPSDAYDYVLENVDYIVPKKGGEGVARHVCDLLLKAQGKYKLAYEKSMSADFERKRTI